VLVIGVEEQSPHN